MNLDDNPGMRERFEAEYDTPRIVSAIQLDTGQAVAEGGPLIILNETQACSKEFTSLKYFCENVPGFAVVAVGSLLGITVHEGIGYSASKVSALDLYPLPLHFREFLAATGNQALTAKRGSKDWHNPDLPSDSV